MADSPNASGLSKLVAWPLVCVSAIRYQRLHVPFTEDDPQ